MIKYYLVRLLKKLEPSAIKKSNIDRKAYISGGNLIVNSRIGKYSYTGYDTQIINTTVGNFCSISWGCRIGGALHPVEFVSMSPLFCGGRNVFLKHFAKHEFDAFLDTCIGNDVWIGQGVYVKSGVKISDGAVIGMGSVVTKDVGPYEIWAGNPAKFIRKRFDDDTIEAIQETQWWLWDDKCLKEKGKYFNNPKEFIREERL